MQKEYWLKVYIDDFNYVLKRIQRMRKLHVLVYEWRVIYNFNLQYIALTDIKTLLYIYIIYKYRPFYVYSFTIYDNCFYLTLE